MDRFTHGPALVASLLILVFATEGQAAACFGSVDWNTVGSTGLCVTSSEPVWNAFVQDLTPLDLRSTGTGVPLTVGGVPPSGITSLAVVPDVVLTEIGGADYDLPSIPGERRLLGGALSEIFLEVPEGPGGVGVLPSLPNELAPGVGLRIGLELGITLNLDFESAAGRPSAWAASFSDRPLGLLELHAVLGYAQASGEPVDTVFDIVPRISIEGPFLGIAAPDGTELARLRIYLAGAAAQGEFVVDSMSYGSRPVPEPTSSILIGLGMLILGSMRKKEH